MSANTDAPQTCVVFFDWIVSCAISFTDGATCLWSSEVHNMSVLAVDSELSNKLKMWEERVFGDEVCCFGKKLKKKKKFVFDKCEKTLQKENNKKSLQKLRPKKK